MSLPSLCLQESPAGGAQLGLGWGLLDGRERDRAIARLASEGSEGRPFQLPALTALRPDGEIVHGGTGSHGGGEWETPRQTAPAHSSGSRQEGKQNILNQLMTISQK